MTYTPNYRTDDLPAGAGPFIIENDRHQWWIVTREFVWRVGGGDGRPHSDEIRKEVGPWRYVSVPLPSDLQTGQANSYLPPELRRSAHITSSRFPQRTDNEEMLLPGLPRDDEPESPRESLPNGTAVRILASSHANRTRVGEIGTITSTESLRGGPGYQVYFQADNDFIAVLAKDVEIARTP